MTLLQIRMWDFLLKSMVTSLNCASVGNQICNQSLLLENITFYLSLFQYFHFPNIIVHSPLYSHARSVRGPPPRKLKWILNSHGKIITNTPQTPPPFLYKQTCPSDPPPPPPRIFFWQQSRKNKIRIYTIRLYFTFSISASISGVEIWIFNEWTKNYRWRLALFF